MTDLLHIDDKYRIKNNIDRTEQMKKKIYIKNYSKYGTYVDKIEWVASFKPALGNITATHTNNIRYDELEIFNIVINNTQNLYGICNPIYSNILYPCLLIIQYKNKFLLSVCQFEAGKYNYNKNAKKRLFLSHWIFTDHTSNLAKEFIDKINVVLSEECELKTMYDNLTNAVSDFHLQCLTRNHINEYFDEMLGSGKQTNATRNAVFEMCDVYKMYKKNYQYEKLSDTNKKVYRYLYDTEELWHAFLLNDDINRVIKGRNFRDMEDLMSRIDNKRASFDAMDQYAQKYEEEYWHIYDDPNWEEQYALLCSCILQEQFDDNIYGADEGVNQSLDEDFFVNSDEDILRNDY